MTYPISKTHSLTPVPVVIPGLPPTTIPGSASSITLPSDWTGYSLLNIYMAYDEATDNILMVYSKIDGVTYWKVEAVAFGPMTSDTPTFGTINVITSGNVDPLWLGLSTDARVAYEQVDDKVYRFTIDGSKNVSYTAISRSGSIVTSGVEYILQGPLGDQIMYDPTGAPTMKTFKVNTSTCDSDITQDTGYTIAGNDKYINFTSTNGLRYITSYSSLAYSTATSGTTGLSFNKLCYDKTRKEVLMYIDDSTSGFIRTYDVDVSTPVLKTSSTMTLPYELRDVHFNSYINKYLYAAADFNSGFHSQIGVLNRKDGGFVVESTLNATNAANMHQHRVISEGKWLIWYPWNNASPSQIKFYKIN